MKKISPFLGSAYYPEDWDVSDMPYDIEKMKEAGMKAARIGEFAWRKMEPSPGKFDFKWLHDVVDALKEAGIAVIMGTPTATPPIWLSREHPDVTVLDDHGARANHGGRRHCCSNNPHYLEASAKIVEAMAKEFGDDENIIGWQIDNEIYTWGGGCVCEHCMAGFHEHLRRKYGTIEELNRQWNLNLFSQAYDSFDEIPAAVRAWHNPHLIYEWSVFQQESNIRFVHMQSDIMKKYIKVPIGTDMMPVNGLDYEKTNEKLDVAMFNHYNTEDNLGDVLFWFDYLRTLKDRPFWNTETSTSWNGSTSIGQIMKPEGFCRINSWLPVALGGEANLYWLWRQHWAGHELVHGSVLSPEGRPLHIFGEVQQIASEFEKAADFINGTKVQTEVALHFTSLNWNLMEAQRIVDRFHYSERLTADFYRPLNRMGLRPDVIGGRKPLDKYKILISPYMLTLEDGDLPERIESWIRDGGVWIAGPMTDVRNSIGAHYRDRAMGMIERITGCELTYSIPDSSKYVKAEWSDGTEFHGNLWYELYSTDSEPLVTVKGTYSSLIGKAVVQKIKVGKGEVILVGSIPSEEDLQKIIAIAAADAGIQLPEVTGELSVIPRVGEEKSGLILVETAHKPASYVIDRPMRDLLTGKTYEAGRIDIDPYGLLLLE